MDTKTLPIKLALALTLLLSIEACSVTKTIPIETIKEVTKVDTIYLNTFRFDSTYVYQGYEKDYKRDLHKPSTINPQPLVDTILIKETNTEIRYKILRDTVERVKIEIQRDSIPYEVRIETIKEVPRPQTLYDRICKVTFWFLIGALLTYCFLKLKAFFKH